MKAIQSRCYRGSGGQRVTDNFEVFPCQQPDEDELYQIHFFVHGLHYMPEETQAYIQELREDTSLFIMQDYQNDFDADALLLRTEDRRDVGYCLRYLTNDLLQLLNEDPQKLSVVVERVNLCKLLPLDSNQKSLYRQ